MKERKLTGSLEQANDELRDAFMNYNELANRCTINFKHFRPGQEKAEAGGDPEIAQQSQSLKNMLAVPEGAEDAESESARSSAAGEVKSDKEAEKKDTKVFYFKPESILMAHPDIQRTYREKLIKQIKALPTMQPPKLLAEELQESLIESVADRSDPTELRKMLFCYFQRKQFGLQHKRYKLLLRWAHHAIRTRTIDNLAMQAQFRNSKLQLELDSTFERQSRLALDDDYKLGLQPELRPTTTSKNSGGSLYVEIKDLPAQSALRQDDIEVYLRHTTYSLKVNKLVNKFMARLKWMGMSQRYDIFESMVRHYFRLREQNIQEQQEALAAMEKAALDSSMHNKSLHEEIQRIKEQSHCSQYQRTMFNFQQKIKGSCRPDYEITPDLINNIPEMKMKIMDLCMPFGLTADLTQDNGFSFAYQLSLFFPTHFQKQIIKSEFTIYDAFAADYKDKNQLQKRSMQSMIRVDPSIFRDVSTNQALIPSEESLAYEVNRMNLKVIRLKASPWVDSVICKPRLSDWQRRQDALLYSDNNPVDTLLSGALDFLDVNDLASVNLVIAESSQIHLDLVAKQHIFEEQEKMSKRSVKIDTNNSDLGAKKRTTQENDRRANNREEVIYQTVSATNIHETNNNLYVQMSNALTGNSSRGLKASFLENECQRRVSKGNLFNLPLHLVQSHNTLRYMESRDNKIKILYCLNYFRSIQKRLMLDLREFGTRERVLGDVTTPLIPPEEADQQLIDTYNMILTNTSRSLQDAENRLLQKEKTTDTQESVSLDGDDKSQAHSKRSQTFEILSQSEMEKHHIKNQFGLVDLKKIRLKGKFHEKHLSTCPILPKFHCAFGEPSEIIPEHVEAERKNSQPSISKESMKLLNRIDHVEIDKNSQEVFIKDDFNVYVMYECALTDMQILEAEMLRVGSFYISKLEELYDSEVDKIVHKKDRQQVVNDMLKCESQLQFKKVMLTELYMECYEHIIDPVEQQRLIQIIVDLMARRPRLCLDALYFKDSYKAEMQCLDKLTELLDAIVQNQISLEKQENTSLHESLNLSYMLAQKKMKDQWTYNDADTYLQDLIEKFKDMQERGQITSSQTFVSFRKKNEMTLFTPGVQKGKTTVTKPSKLGSNDGTRNEDDDLRNIRYADQELDSDAFKKLLGLPKITLEHLFEISKENDEVVLDIMAETSYFHSLFDGYPDLMSLKHSGVGDEADAEGSHGRGFQSNQQQTKAYRTVLGSTQKSFTVKPKQQQVYLTSQFSRPEQMSVLDFYSDSMNFVTKLTAILENVCTELSESLKPHDSMMAACLETQVYEYALKQYR